MTTEQKHTPEPWYFDAKENAVSQVGVDDLSICTVDGIDECSKRGWAFGEISKANARRIVACVNACEGIDTEAIEAILANKSSLYIEWVQKAEQVIEFKKERDTLAAKVEELEVQLSAYPADWRRDSSLESWFPYTAEKQRNLESKLSAVTAQRDDLLAALKRLACLGNGDKYGNSDGNIIAQEAIAKLGQTADKARSAVVPDELIDAVKEIAGSHTNNEITDRPVWWIIDPRQILKPSVHEFYGTFKGPFFSREAATEYMESHRYRYGKHVKVYCGSCNDAPQFKKLYDISAAMLKGEK